MKISNIVRDAGCTLSVYADDLTISGKIVPEVTIWKIKKMLRRHGHRYQINKERRKYLKPSEVTGVILSHDKLDTPNRLHKKLYELRRELKGTKSKTRRATLEMKFARPRGPDESSKSREFQLKICPRNSASHSV